MVGVTTCSATTANMTSAGCALVTGKHTVPNTTSAQGNNARHFTDGVGTEICPFEIQTFQRSDYK